MKVNLYLITYEGEERREVLFEDLSEEEQTKIGTYLTEMFMESAGFSPMPE